MKEALAEVGDFKIGGRMIIEKVRFADDTAILLNPSVRELNAQLTEI
jgi:hypothetical protein